MRNLQLMMLSGTIFSWEIATCGVWASPQSSGTLDPEPNIIRTLGWFLKTTEYRRRGDIRAIVLRTTDSQPFLKLGAFDQPEPDIWVHFYITKNGTIIQIDSVLAIARHTDLPDWDKGSIAIAIENIPWANLGVTATSNMRQLASLVDLSRWLCQEYDIPRRWIKSGCKGEVHPPVEPGIIGHNQIWRESPPLSFMGLSQFPWTYFMEEINKPPAAEGIRPGTTTANDPGLWNSPQVTLRWNSMDHLQREKGRAVGTWQVKIRFFDPGKRMWESLKLNSTSSGATHRTYVLDRVGFYNWRVRARNSWEEGLWSRRLYFRYRGPPPQVRIWAPKHGETHQPPVNVRWAPATPDEAIDEYEAALYHWNTNGRRWDLHILLALPSTAISHRLTRFNLNVGWNAFRVVPHNANGWGRAAEVRFWVAAPPSER